MRVICWVLSYAALAAFSAALAGEDLPKGVTLITPDKIQWVKTPSGRELAYLHGHPDKPGPYLLPREMAAYGDRFDERKLHAHPAGSYFTEPANTAHFGLTRGEGAVLYFYGVGPSGNVPLEK